MQGCLSHCTIGIPPWPAKIPIKTTVPWYLIVGILAPLIGNPYNGHIKSYYWVDDRPLLYGNSGSLDPGTHDPNNLLVWSTVETSPTALNLRIHDLLTYQLEEPTKQLKSQPKNLSPLAKSDVSTFKKKVELNPDVIRPRHSASSIPL